MPLDFGLDIQHVPKYVPAEITNADVVNLKRTQIGPNFKYLTDEEPEITDLRGKKLTIRKISTVEEADLHCTVYKNWKHLETELTYVQKWTIPAIKLGKDLIVCSPTGTGKTAAYLLPILSNLLNMDDNSAEPSPLVLILTPTHELSIQAVYEAKRFLINSVKNIKIKIIYGETDTIWRVDNLEEGCHILVGTPGAVREMLDEDRIELSCCRYLVLDDVDRFLIKKDSFLYDNDNVEEETFLDDISHIMKLWHNEFGNNIRQMIMCSATFTDESLQLLQYILPADSDPIFVFFSNKFGVANEDIKQIIENIPINKRLTRLVELLNEQVAHYETIDCKYKTKTLVFVNRRSDVKDVMGRLKSAGIGEKLMGGLHRNMPQADREQSLSNFRNGIFPILIATSVASRGLDIVGVDLVINFELRPLHAPESIADYIHRIGRTGRLGNEGKAITFFDERHEPDMKIAQKLIKVLSDAKQDVPSFLLACVSEVALHEKIDKVHLKTVCRGFRPIQHTETVVGPSYENISFRKPKVRKMIPGNSNYVPNEITDEEIINAPRIPMGAYFEDLENMTPQIVYGKKSVQRKIRNIASIEDANLHETIVRNLEECGITKLSYVQKWSIPAIFLGSDLIVCSPTGTGKTAAYLLPVLSTLLNDTKERSSMKPLPFALIVVPTHELAIQIMCEARRFTFGQQPHRKVCMTHFHNLVEYFSDSDKKVTIVYGGTNMKWQRQKLQEGCDILIGTPGRLLHMIEEENIDLSHCRYVILDEIDRLMEGSFVKDVHQIMENYYYKCENENRQTLSFTATFPPNRQQMLFKFFFVDNDYNFLVFDMFCASRDVEQIVELVLKAERFHRLFELLGEAINSANVNKGSKTLVFINSQVKMMLNRLTNAGIPSEAVGTLYGDMSQRSREETLTKFRNGDFPILLATSIASRGLDIIGVDHVNFDLPQDITDYIHRIGRTGRIGNRGKATSFFDDTQQSDKIIATPLVKVLADAQQVVPEFLERLVTNVSNYGKKHKNNIKNDLRLFAQMKI